MVSGLLGGPELRQLPLEGLDGLEHPLFQRRIGPHATGAQLLVAFRVPCLRRLRLRQLGPQRVDLLLERFPELRLDGLIALYNGSLKLLAEHLVLSVGPLELVAQRGGLLPHQLAHVRLQGLVLRSLLGLEVLAQGVPHGLALLLFLRNAVREQCLDAVLVLGHLLAKVSLAEGVLLPRFLVELRQARMALVDLLDKLTRVPLGVLGRGVGGGVGLLGPGRALVHALLEVPAAATQGLLLAVQPLPVLVEPLHLLLQCVDVLAETGCELRSFLQDLLTDLGAPLL
mmetsp:Transcript_76304/g.202630  ORF Transcript_76304/g.202630 Transcript_76304/m.202630 type:complete len:285 (-) Transcript_76304:397-1251(-)